MVYSFHVGVIMNKVKCDICGEWYELRKGEHRYDGKRKLCKFCKKTLKK